MIILYLKNMMRISSSLIFIALFILVLISIPVAETQHIPLLVQVWKSQKNLEKIFQDLDISVLEEMNTFYLAVADREELSVMRNLGLRFHFLTTYEPGMNYYLARITNLDDYHRLSSFSRIIRLEDRDCLLISAEKIGERFPPGVRWKPLYPKGRKSVFPGMVSSTFKVRDIDEAFQQIAAEVSVDNLRAAVARLQNFGTRYAYTEGCSLAGDYIFNYFSSLGLQPRFHEFTQDGSRLKNVVVDIPGQTYPDQVVILCAHYDSISGERWTLAPGADDNASGTAAIMEAARILKERPHDFTIRLVAFTAEEVGLIGSSYYASTSESTRGRVIAVINLDMIAYADDLPEDLDIVTNDFSDWLAERAVSSVQVYGPVAARKFVMPSFVYSDHSSFWDRGIPAICAIEDQDVNNPYYHQATDTVDTLNFDFYLGSTRGVLVCGSDVAQLLRPGWPSTPRDFSINLITYVSIFNYIKKVQLKWTPVPGVAGYNVYRSRYSHTGYEKLNKQLLSQTEFLDTILPGDWPFYYTVTAVDSLNRESNMTRELVVAPGVSYFQGNLSEQITASAGVRRN